MRIYRFQSTLIALLFSVGLGFFFLVQNAGGQTPTSTPVVHTVLFYRSTCSYCQKLVTETLPPIQDKYKNQLEIYYSNVSLPQEDILFSAAIKRFDIKTIGTPTIIVGDNVLIGSKNIQEQFPRIIDAGLSRGGLDWPDIPGLSQNLAIARSTQTPAVTETRESSSSLTSATPAIVEPPISSQNPAPSYLLRITDGMRNNFTRDPAGNTISIVILAGMIFSVIYGSYTFIRKPSRSYSRQPLWLIPALCMLGCGVAGYLAYVEVTYANAICGPVGNCQAVQESAYARLFGVIPLGLLGLAGYVAVLIAWFIRRFSHPKLADLASLVLLGITASGTLFSIYLTFLEPFVIGASCLWCLTSAVLMTALFYLNIAPGKSAYTHLFKKTGDAAIPGLS